MSFGSHANCDLKCPHKRRAWQTFAVVSISLIAPRAAGEPIVRPAGLAPGDTIMIIAPAGEANLESVEVGRARLEKAGFHVVVPETIGRQRGYLSGSDEQRAAELVTAFADARIDAIFCFTGGYGTTRMLDLIDYKVVANNPKVFVGFSDITGLHLALAAKCNFITFHGPNIDSFFETAPPSHRYRSLYLWRNVLQTPNAADAPLEYIAPIPEHQVVSLRPGVARGPLAGGNLTLMSSLMGTEYELQTAGRVLFLEDVREQPYRVDRMLSQLRLAGKLRAPAAVVLGAFYKCERNDSRSLTLDEVFDDYFVDAPYPVIKNFPAGHGLWNATLPLGAVAEVDGNSATLRVLHSPVATTSQN